MSEAFLPLIIVTLLWQNHNAYERFATSNERE